MEEELVERAHDLVRKHYGDDARAWLVGSRVSGEHDDDSDLDVVVETDAMHRKRDPGVGCGRYFEDAWHGIDIDICEEPDGPIWRDDAEPVRLQ